MRPLVVPVLSCAYNASNRPLDGLICAPVSLVRAMAKKPDGSGGRALSALMPLAMSCSQL